MSETSLYSIFLLMHLFLFIHACRKHKLHNGTNDLKGLQWNTGILFPPREACDECAFVTAEHSQT